MSDGITLEAKVLRPDGVSDTERTSVVFDAGPYFGRFQTTAEGRPLEEANPQPATHGLLAHGYTVVLVSARGYGGSGGCWDFHGARDRADMADVVAWLESREWSDGQVAAAGFSYDGGMAVDALASGADLDAAILQAPQVQPYTSLFINRLRAVRPYTAQAFGPGVSAADASGPAGDGDQTENVLTANPVCWAANIAEILRNDRTTDWWRERDAVAAMGSTDVPVLLSYGLQDDLVKTEAMLPMWRALDGHREAWFGQFDHTPADGDEYWPSAPPLVAREGYLEQKLAFLDRHLRGIEPDELAPRVAVQEGSTGGWRSESQWPPRDLEPATLALRPGTYVDKPGNTADARGNAATQNNPPAEQGAGTWTFSAPLAASTHMAGEALVTIDVRAAAPGAHVVALLYDVDVDGMATMVSRMADEVDADGRNQLTLYPQDWRFAKGHRIGLLISGGDDSLVEPAHTLQTVTVSGGTLTLPVLNHPHRDDLAGGPNYAMSIRRPFEVEPGTASRRTTSRSRGLRIERPGRAARGG